jgi:hypothetical protein
MQDDPRRPFDPERFLDGFTEEGRQVPVDPDSPLGQAMARARAAWGEAGPPDPSDFVFDPPTPVEPSGE